MVALVLLLSLGQAASGAAAPQRRGADLELSRMPAFVGAGKVASGGDVNGDGFGDVLVSKGDLSGGPSQGIVYVVFGKRGLGQVDLASVEGSDAGFVIHGPEPEAYASQVVGAGDVNGDGLDDILVGAPWADLLSTGEDSIDDNYWVEAGAAYVVFGKPTTASVDLSEFDRGVQGTQGYRIAGPGTFKLAGRSVAALGDVNSDSLDDVVIGAPFAGTAYVVYGKRDPSEVQLTMFDQLEVNPLGFRIDVPKPTFDGDLTVGGGGDVNGDGVPDVVVGSTPYHRAGSLYVVFGGPAMRAVDTRDLGDGGFRVRGRPPRCIRGEPRCFSHLLDMKATFIEDVNDDGRDELLIGEPGCCGYGRGYIIFGSPDAGREIRLAHPGEAGIVILGDRYARLGTAVSAAGDVNRDGVPDVVLGAPFADFYDRNPGVWGGDPGGAYVVFGQSEPGIIDLRVTKLAMRIGGIDAAPRNCGPYVSRCPGDRAGTTVGSLDIDGDGYLELLIGAPYAGRPGQAGAAYIVNGRQFHS